MTTAEFNDPQTRPPFPCRCEVKPFQTVDMISEAAWDGEKWRYLASGRECYIQDLAWRISEEEKAA